jgi:predicted MPP superfamily phosphohydrolase
MSSAIRRGTVLGLAAIWLLAIHMVLFASSRPIMHITRVSLPDWPAGAPPRRIALLSDFHTAAPSDTPSRLARIVSVVNALHPDLVLLAGDFLSNGSIATRAYDPAESIAPLAALRAPFGVLAVPGNHDYALFPALVRAFKAIHVPLLVNQAVRAGPIAVLAVDDASHNKQPLSGVLAQWHQIGGVPIALTHDPFGILKMPADVRLALAGHTHCGQVSPPPIGPIVTSSRAGLLYACGIVIDRGRTTIVTGGLGTSDVPFRLGAAPDFWIVEVGR